MNEISKYSSKIIKLLSAAFMLLIGYFISVSPIVGSQCAFFSASDLILPIIGYFGISFIAIMSLLKIIFFNNFISFMTPLYHLSGICGALAWSRFTIFYRVILPLICMIIFSIHSVGQLVIPYTFYWLIPPVLYLFKRQSIFENALACTFVTHAVGSVIWLYFKNIGLICWWSLIPVVPFERFFSALLMTAVYYMIQECARFIRTKSIIQKTKKLFYKNYN